MAQADLLRDVLELAGKEKALEGEGLAAFAAALRDRAQIVLAERITPLEKENAWRGQAMEGLEERVRGLEKENAWLREAMDGLTASARGLEAENAWRREAMDRLKESVKGLEERALWLDGEVARRAARIEALADEHERATRAHEQATHAHDQLAAHHRSVVRQVVAEVQAVAALPWLRARQARQRLTSLVALLLLEAP